MSDIIDPDSQTWAVTPDLLGVIDSDGIFRKTNPAWFKTLGRLPEDIESRLFFDFLHPDDIPRAAKAFVDIQHGQPILGFQNRYRHKDGSYRWLSWNAVPEGDIFYCTARDITVDKVTEEALDRLDQEATFREQFISILGHDLRNPLAGAACAVEYLMDREQLTDNGTVALQSASLSLHRMSRLIDDVLDFARSRLGGGIGLVLEPDVGLEDILRQTVDEVRYANTEIVFEEDYRIDSPVKCDSDRIAQLISNLLGNAVFHNEPGGTIQIRAAGTASDVTVAITNRGATIPADVMAVLFEPFSRAEPGSSQNGLGLGLFICKQIADRHGGTIDVTSEHGETTFTLHIPNGEEQIAELLQLRLCA